MPMGGQGDDGRRELQFLKNQYGKLATRIALLKGTTDCGCRPPKGKVDESDLQTEAERKAEDLFLRLLRRFTRRPVRQRKQGRRATHRPNSR